MPWVRNYWGVGKGVWDWVGGERCELLDRAAGGVHLHLIGRCVDGAPAAPPHRERRVSAAATYCATPHTRVWPASSSPCAGRGVVGVESEGGIVLFLHLSLHPSRAGGP